MPWLKATIRLRINSRTTRSVSATTRSVPVLLAASSATLLRMSGISSRGICHYNHDPGLEPRITIWSYSGHIPRTSTGSNGRTAGQTNASTKNEKQQREVTTRVEREPARVFVEEEASARRKQKEWPKQYISPPRPSDRNIDGWRDGWLLFCAGYIEGILMEVCFLGSQHRRRTFNRNSCSNCLLVDSVTSCLSIGDLYGGQLNLSCFCGM